VALGASERGAGDQLQGAVDATILAWWREEGGRRVTFGSDAHEPRTLGADLTEAAAMAEAHSFRPDTRPEDAWIVTS
jgi:histidinol-phosphatase (PHP family)